MKKVFYNSWIAKHLLLPGYSTITIMAFVFTKYKTLKQYIINHECTHARQWIELTILSGFIIWLLCLVFDISAWWLILSAFVFYLWYVIEWLIKGFIYGFDNAYKKVSFEYEARLAENDNNYLENSHYFDWIKYLK